MAYSFPPDKAWLPLDPAHWTPDAARHLLRRVCWTARSDDVERAVREGLDATLARLFPSDIPLFPRPRSIDHLSEAIPDMQAEARTKTGDERRAIERQIRERERLALEDLSLKWLAYASDPQSAAYAKWTLFLSDVYVVSAEKVRNAALIYRHFDTLARHGLGPAPALSKAVSRSPAMVIYLDLGQSQKKAPNENFARELFELFVLGEGNYTEKDIKEAARAFTGYRYIQREGEFRFVPAQHDDSPKTVFGATGRFTGDEVIDLAYKQPAAASFLPHEMVKFYLSDTPLPAEYLAAIGTQWSAKGFELRSLITTFFGSQLFYAPEFRANFIKSPIQFYLGLAGDLQLDVAPLPRMTLNPLRQMGQWLFYPPNVRGWVGGSNWINSATITARRQMVEMSFAPINEKALNADELIDLTAARSNGVDHFTVSDAQLAAFADMPPATAAERLTREFMPATFSASFQKDLEAFLEQGHNPAQRLRAIRRVAATLFQSPEYQLC